MQSGHWDGRAFRNRFHAECWTALIEDSEYRDFEFTPGELDPPARLVAAPPHPNRLTGSEEP